MSSDHNLRGPARCYIVFAVPKGHLAHAIVRLRDVTSAVPDAWRFECRYIKTICIFSNIPLKELSVSSQCWSGEVRYEFTFERRSVIHAMERSGAVPVAALLTLLLFSCRVDGTEYNIQWLLRPHDGMETIIIGTPPDTARE